jgi:DNA-binding IscR family transcriptional regulator
LQRARLVETRKGAGSGSRLSRSPGRINLAEVYRAVEAVEPFASPARKANTACPVGHCIRKTLNQVFASAENALERDLEKTTLAGVIGMIKASCPGAAKKAG